MNSAWSFPESGRLLPWSARQWLIISCCFSVILLLARILVTGSFTYSFLIWNLFLGSVPFMITGWMTRNPRLIENRLLYYLILAAWLLFIPNSFYIITDLFHLTHVDSAPKWFDLLLIFSFAWNGLLFGILSLRRVELFISLVSGRAVTALVVFVVMWLSALGIYIGRFLRYNSWDVVTDPFTLLSDIGEMIWHPVENGYAWGMTGIYGVFMTLLYFTFRRIGESMAQSR